MKEYYDLYMSIGIACRPAMHLNISDLRNESFPLDWQMAYSLETVIHLFKTSFEDFFSDIEEDINQGGAKNNRRIIDIKNNIISIHHFSKNIKLEEAQKNFKIKMKKRFQILDSKLKQSKKVVLISNRCDSINDLKYFLKEFSHLYPNLEIRLINVRSDEKLNSDSCEKEFYNIATNLSIVDYRVNDTFNSVTQEMYGPWGNLDVWSKILTDYYRRDNYELFQKFKNEHESIVIYGAGKRCLNILKKFRKYDIQIKGIAVSNTKDNPQFINGYGINTIEKYYIDDLIIISLADEDEVLNIKRELTQKGYHKLATLDNFFRINFE